MLARSLVGFWTCEGFLAGASSAGYMRAAFGMATAGAREVCQGKAQRSEAASRIDAARGARAALPEARVRGSAPRALRPPNLAPEACWHGRGRAPRHASSGCKQPLPLCPQNVPPRARGSAQRSPPDSMPAVNTFMGHGAAVASPARAPRDVTPPSKGASRQGTLAAASKGEPGAPQGARLATARRLRAAPLCDPTSHARLTARAASPAG